MIIPHNNQKILAITGASGFVGRRLVQMASEAGWTVRTISHEDVWNEDKIREILRDVSAIINLAAYGQMRWQQDQKETYVANVALPHYLHCKMCQYAALDVYLVLVSSLAAFSPSGAYAWTKHYTDMSLSRYPNVKTAFLGSVYGPGEDQRRLIPTMIQAAEDGTCVNVDTTAEYDRIYIDDVCRALLLLASKRTPGGDYGVGTGVLTSNLQVLKGIEAVTKKSIHYKVNRKIVRRGSELVAANPNKLLEYAWQRPMSLSEGIKTLFKHEK